MKQENKPKKWLKPWEGEWEWYKDLKCEQVDRNMESTTSVLCHHILFPPLLSSSSVCAAVKMDASQWREEPRSVSYSPALPQAHYNPPFQKSLPPSPAPLSPFTQAYICPHPSLSPGSNPSQHDRQAQLTVPVSGERKPSREVKWLDRKWQV